MLDILKDYGTADLICSHITLNKSFWASRIQQSPFVAVERLSMSTILIYHRNR